MHRALNAVDVGAVPTGFTNGGGAGFKVPPNESQEDIIEGSPLAGHLLR